MTTAHKHAKGPGARVLDPEHTKQGQHRHPAHIERIDPGDERAHNALLDLEELTQNELNGFLKMYRHLADEGRKRV